MSICAEGGGCVIIYQDRMKAGTLKPFIARKDKRYFLRLIGINFVPGAEIQVEPVYQAAFELQPFEGGLMVLVPQGEEYLIIVLRDRKPFIEFAKTGIILEDEESSDVGG